MNQLPAPETRVQLARPAYIDYTDQDQHEPPSGGLLEYWRIIQRRRGAVILITILGLIAGVVFTLPQTPVYQARTTLEIQSLNDDFMNMKNVNPTNSGSNGYYPEIDIQTQVKILQSRTLVERAVKKAQSGDQPLVSNGTRLSAWRKALHLAPAKDVNNRENAIDMASSALKVRAQANTRLVDVSVDSTDPRAAADFANALTSEFIEQNLDARWQTTQHTGEFLEHQMEEVKIKLEKSEDALQAYARQTNLIFTQEKDNVADQKLKQLQDELSKAQAERVARQSRHELAGKAAVESIGEVQDDTSLKDIQSKLTDLRRQRAEYESIYTPTHPRMVKIDAQIAELEGASQTERGRIVRRIGNDFDAAQRRERLLAADYAAQVKLMTSQADNVAHYNILKREVDTNRQIYDSMLQRVKEASIASALRASNIRVVDAAVAPKFPYKPSLFVNGALGLLGGIFLGIVFVVFQERADRTVQEPGDMTTYLGIPELGTVPSAIADSIHHRRFGPLSPAHIGAGQSLELITMQRKPSPMAEAVRATLTSILFRATHGEHPQVIVMSSAAPKEGKTTLCTNLAIALSEIHGKVLLIDADLRKPRLHKIFDLENRASRLVPWAVCLSRARVLDSMLAARHIPVTVRVGVAYPDGKFQAHAWVEHNGKVILGGPVDQYTLLADVNFRASEVVQASACAELKLRQPNQ